MGLTAEEKALMAKLQKKAEEPDVPPPSVNYSLDLSSDSAWERAKQLGLVSDPEPENGDDPENDDDPEGPKRSSGADRFFGGR